VRAGPVRGVAAVLLAALLAAGPAQSENAEWLSIPSGGLSIRPVPGLALGSLVLTLSPDQVKASYLLVNGSELRRVLDVGFPIPSQARPSAEAPPLAEAFSDAMLTLDGAALELADVRIRVFMLEQDVTEVLSAAGVDLKTLANGSLAEQPRERRRAMEKALIDAGIAVDPAGWGLAVEPAWEVPMAPRSTALLTLTYTPYPGRAVDSLPGDELLEDLAHLAAYCAEEQDGLLAWVRQQVVQRAADDAAEQEARGRAPEVAAANAFADIELLDLTFHWRNGGWPSLYPKVELIVDPGAGRAAFCSPHPDGDAAPHRGDDGSYRLELLELAPETDLDIMFLR